MCTRVLVLFLAFAAVAVSATHLQEDTSEVRKHGSHLLTKLWYYALPWLFAFKVKIVIVAVAVTLFILKLWSPYGGYGGYTGYSYEPDWHDEHGHEARQLSGFTDRVMRGLEAAEMTWRAANNDGGCGARLACEARRSARNDQLAASMVTALGKSLDDLDVSKQSDNCEAIDCHLALAKPSKSRRRR